MDEDFDLGRLLGRREAFAVVAARCSAADAATLRQIREEKIYRARCRDWGEFCSTYLHLSKAHANRIIQLLDEFGPGYFDLAQLTRISPDTYRAVAPTIQDNNLHYNDEEIELIPENAARVAAVVSEIRRASAALRDADPAGNQERRIVAAVEQLCAMAAISAYHERIANVARELRSQVEKLEAALVRL